MGVTLLLLGLLIKTVELPSSLNFFLFVVVLWGVEEVSETEANADCN